MAKKSKGKKKYDTAYLKAVEEIEKDKVNEIKAGVKGLLEALMTARRERKRIDDKIDFLAQDLEDIRHGHIDKLKKRHEEEKEAAKSSPIKVPELEKWQANTAYAPAIERHTRLTPLTTGTTAWGNATSGSFTLTDGSTVTIGPATA